MASGKSLTDSDLITQWNELLELQKTDRVNRLKIHEALLNKKRE
jgi:hypothetical protein